MPINSSVLQPVSPCRVPRKQLEMSSRASSVTTLSCCQSGGVGHKGTATPLFFHSQPEHNKGSRSLADSRIKQARHDGTAQMQWAGLLVQSHSHTLARFELCHTWGETGASQCKSTQPKMHPKNYSPQKTCFPPSFIKGTEFL